jgi:hypothetical protein
MTYYLYNFDYRNRVNDNKPIFLNEPPELVRLKVDFGCEIPKLLYKLTIKNNYQNK